MIRQAANAMTALVLLASVAFSQEADTDRLPEVDDGKPTIADPERCFVMPAVLAFNVLSDQHAYIRTRGNNHYLITTVRQCRNLKRAYERDRAYFVPHGRRVCQNDGSHILYDTGARVEPCPIMTIEAVENREHADSIVAGDEALIDIEPIDPPD
jgi:hypothetical protein